MELELKLKDAGKVVQRELMGAYYSDLEHKDGPIATTKTMFNN